MTMMVKPLALLLLTLAPCAGLYAQERPLLIVGPDTTSVHELQYAYQKNLRCVADGAQQGLDDFIASYALFRMKVLDAYAEGLAQKKSFKTEYARYRDYQLGLYLLDSSHIDSTYRALYAHFAQEKEVSHILLLAQDSAQAEEAQRLADKLYARLRAGEEFAALAKAYSQDSSTAHQGGRLGYISALTMIYPFEQAAYSTPVGQVAPPFSSPMGYHLIKVTSQRPARGSIQAALLYLPLPPSASVQAKAAAQEKMEAARNALLAGESINSLVHQHQAQGDSSLRQGMLQDLRPGRHPEQLVNLLFSLQHDGDYTPVTRMPYGYAIFQRVALNPPPSYQRALPQLRAYLEQAGQPVEGSQALLASIQRNLRIVTYEKNLQALLCWGSKADHQPQLPNGPLDSATLLQVNNHRYSASSFYQWVLTNFSPDTPRDSSALRLAFQDYADTQCLRYAIEKLTAQHPDLPYLLNEFHDGLLLFDISDQKVWNSPSLQPDSLQAFYQRHRHEFRYDSCYTVESYIASDSLALAKAAKHLCTQRAKSATPRGLKNGQIKMTSQRLSTQQLRASQWKQQCNPARSNRCPNPCSTITRQGAQFILQRLVKLETNVPMSYQECLPLLMAKCQQRLLDRWQHALAQRYPVYIDPEALEALKHLLHE